MAKSGVFSCVVDANPRLHLDALRWFAALTRVARVPPWELVVHTVGGGMSDALEYLRRQGVRIRPVEAFHPRSPHCNKIAGALALASTRPQGVVVLTDSDVVVVRDPRVLEVPAGCIAAKVVDAPNPPLGVVQEVFGAAGLELPGLVRVDFDPSAETIVCNANGGFYVVPAALLPRLARSWSAWARWLLDRDLLGSYTFFTDQVAMAMALADERIGVVPLGREWNYPSHVEAWISSDDSAPFVVHYHDRTEPTGLISRTGRLNVDSTIDLANAAIAKLWRHAFPNQTFWDWRYTSNPALGSGVGSRGAALAEKRRILGVVIDSVHPTSTLDVGCGDGEATRGLPLPRYTGLDVSQEAIRLASLARPEGSFHVKAATEWSERGDLVICLDVLIHLADLRAYQETAHALLRLATQVLLVSGYERMPTTDSPMVHFHEPLSTTVRSVDGKALVLPLREEHEITTLAIVKPGLEERSGSALRKLASQYATQH